MFFSSDSFIPSALWLGVGDMDIILLHDISCFISLYWEAWCTFSEKIQLSSTHLIVAAAVFG